MCFNLPKVDLTPFCKKRSKLFVYFLFIYLFHFLFFFLFFFFFWIIIVFYYHYLLLQLLLLLLSFCLFFTSSHFYQLENSSKLFSVRSRAILFVSRVFFSAKTNGKYRILIRLFHGNIRKLWVLLSYGTRLKITYCLRIYSTIGCGAEPESKT